MKKKYLFSILFQLLLTSFLPINGQMITGVWHGKINRQKAEVKIVLNGDSLTGTSYYYESPNNYRRYSIKGYFDEQTNTAVWWDDQLVDERSGRLSVSTPGRIPLVSQADFNCPGDGTMMLDGNTSKKEDVSKITGELHLDKKGSILFQDEWDFVIENYTVGANDPDIIDSVAMIAFQKPKTENEPVIAAKKEETDKPVRDVPQKTAEPVTVNKKEVVKKPEPVVKTNPAPTQPTIEEKFTARKKELISEIPVSGDSIELRFYDNAEIDGDSISLFLNDKLIFEHIRLLATPYIIKIAVTDLNQSNDLIMVAENMGSIPPNTSYMLALVDGKRYEAYLTSTEGSSAMIRLYKQGP